MVTAMCWKGVTIYKETLRKMMEFMQYTT